MNIEFVPIQDQHGHLHIRMERADFEPKIKDKLQSIRKTAHLKGFRQGAAPMSIIQKLYGDQIRAEIIDKMLNESVENYQKANKISFIGDLLPVNDTSHDKVLTENNLEFVFEVGLAPSVFLEQALETLQIEKYKINIPEDRITEELEHLRERASQPVDVDGTVQENDLIQLDAEELDGDFIKDDGIKSQFTVLIGPEITQDFRNEVLGRPVGYGFNCSISSIEKNVDLIKANTYYLKLDKDQALAQVNDRYRCSITKIFRKVKAELDADFFQKVFGQQAQVTNEEDARRIIREKLNQYFSVEAEKMLDVHLLKALHKELNLAFPDAFLKKWLTHSFEEWKNKSSQEVARDLIQFKEALAWRIIRDKLTNSQDIRVNVHEVEEKIISTIRGQYPNLELPSDSWKALARRTLEDRDRAYEYYTKVLDQKAVDYLKSRATIKEVEISLEEFRAKVRAINEPTYRDNSHENVEADHNR